MKAVREVVVRSGEADDDGPPTQRGCCILSLQGCIALQLGAMTVATMANWVRAAYKVVHFGEHPDSPFVAAIKGTRAGSYLDVVDVAVSMVGGSTLLVSCARFLEGLFLCSPPRPSYFRPYMVGLPLFAAGLSTLLLLAGLATTQALMALRTAPNSVPRVDGVDPTGLAVAGLDCAEVWALVFLCLMLLFALVTYCLVNVSTLYRFYSMGPTLEHFFYIGV